MAAAVAAPRPRDRPAAPLALLKIRARRGFSTTRRRAACDCLSPALLGRRRIGIARYCDGTRSIKGRPKGANFGQNHLAGP